MSNLDPNHIEFELTPEDSVQFGRHNRFSRHRWARDGFLWVVMLVCVAVLTWIASKPGADRVERFGALIVALALFFPLQNCWIRAQTKRQLKGRDGALRRITLTPEQIICVTEAAEVRVLWTGVPRVESDRSHIYIFRTESSAFVIPKRAFSDPAIAATFFEAAEKSHRAADSVQMK